ncbi:MAG: prolyl oligopeptidase family serine peptidase [Pirellulales bacterium]|nr:prolyl oligopeptidase family serine peptidase [Pirellulales bacterium]
MLPAKTVSAKIHLDAPEIMSQIRPLRIRNFTISARSISCIPALALCLAFVAPAGTALGAAVQQTFGYKSSITSDAGGPLDLYAELNYDNARQNAPIAVVMHGYSGSTGHFANVRANAQRLRDGGFFVISVAMRGREGSDGVRDSGGLEIYDIYDAVEKAKTQFAPYVNPNNISITGYSGGGGNAMSALTKFPDYFRAGSSFFGISDYGLNTQSGWYFLGAASNHQTQLRTDIGDPTLGNAAVTERYRARASNLASKNNPYSEIHLFVNDNEPTCPKINDSSYRDSAIAAAAYPGEFNNINVHIGVAGTYKDFNNNGINESREQQYWPHGFPTADQQYAAEAWYLDRLLSGAIPQPVLNASDQLFIAGFVKTKPFEFWVGDGQNAAGELTYNLANDEKSFTLGILGGNAGITGRLKVDTADMAGKLVRVSINGTAVDEFTGGGIYQRAGIPNSSTIVLAAVPEPGQLGFMSTGLAGLLIYRRLRKHSGANCLTSL